jgi:hypothetical protein
MNCSNTLCDAAVIQNRPVFNVFFYSFDLILRSGPSSVAAMRPLAKTCTLSYIRAGSDFIS